jgi:diguanylate cyclase (GGDEF)-like protein
VSSRRSQASDGLLSCWVLTEDEAFLAAAAEGLARESVSVRELHPDDLRPGIVADSEVLLLDWREVDSAEKALRVLCDALSLREPAGLALTGPGVDTPLGAPLVECCEVLPEWSRVAASLVRLAGLRLRLLGLDAERLLVGHYDALTGFMRRHVFLDALDDVFSGASAEALPIALLSIDLDGFKRANDRHGHWLGDQVLRQVSERLRRTTRYSPEVPRARSEWYLPRFGRMGGDEFAVLLPGVAADAALALAIELTDAVSADFEVGGEIAALTASIGVASTPEDAGNPGSLLRNALLAMQQAKRSGGNRARAYSESTGAAVRRKTSIESGLRGAIEGGELELYFQSRHRARSGRITGAEGLLRWNSPTLGQVSPVDFIPIAEDAGLIAPLGNWVMHELCRYVRHWYELGDPLRFSFNVSAIELLAPELPGNLLAALMATGVSPQHIELEVTESIAIHHVPGAVEILENLQETGVQIALDDFGTGYSSFSVLIDLPLDTLKLDRSIISGLGTNPDVSNVAGAMIGMAHGLGLSVVAEGVETETQLNILRNLDCDEVQGFYYSPPVPADEFERLVLDDLV